MRKLKYAAILLWLWLCPHVMAQQAPPSMVWQVPADVEQVTDGDTLIVLARPYPNMFYHDKVRLLELDTPEISRAKCVTERLAGERAKARAKQLVLNTPIMLQLTGERDNFGRLLARVRLADGRDFSDIMVAENLGTPQQTRNWCDILG